MDPAAISTGLGQGMAQVFKPQEDFLGEAMKAAEAKKKESAANRAKALSELGKMNEYHVWTERDGTEFAKKQKEVWDGMQGKDLDDPNTMLWLNQKQQELSYLADRSNQDRELYKQAANNYASDNTKYFKESVDNLQKFASPDNALGTKMPWNPSIMMTRPDLDSDISKLVTNAQSWVDRNKKEGARVGTLPGGGETKFKIEETTGGYPVDKAVNDMRVYMSEPNNMMAVRERYNAEDPDHTQYKDEYEYAEKVLAPKIASSFKAMSTAQLSNAGFGGGAGSADTPRGYSITQVSQETPTINQAQVESVAEKLLKRPTFKSTYDALAVEDENGITKLPKVSLPNGKQRDMTIEEYAMDMAKSTPTAQQKTEGYTYDFGRASKTSEATEIGYLETPTGKYKGVRFKPTRITFKENGEPVVIGLDIKQNTVEVPYSEIHAKLINETGGDWGKLKEKVIKEVGFDPFSKYESKTAPSTGEANPKRDATGKTAAAQTTSQQSSGDWNDDWTKGILSHERTVGAPGGKPFGTGAGYDDANWIGKNAKRDIVKEYVDPVKKLIPEYSNLPDAFKIRLIDYRFNSGRDPRVAILSGLGLIDSKTRTYLHNQGKADVDQYWDKNKANIDMSDPKTIKAFDNARTEITKATNVNDPNYKGNIEKNQLPRIALADQILSKSTGEAKTATPVQGKATGSVLKDYTPDVQERIKKVMAANNIDETTAIEALKKAGKLK